MAVQVYAGETLVYDSRLVLDPKHARYALLGLKTTTGLNKGGTLELVMSPGHPAYNLFVSYRTVVTLRENGALRWRGRALYPSDEFYNCRTITCEGERCFLRDGVIRPYLYQDTPAAIFADALEQYNAQVDGWKQFALGTVTVTDANDYIRLENESAETFADFFDKLVARCGGYITFTDDGKGGRAINWLAEIGSESDQAIEFGQNLLDFALSGQSDELATALVPYGAVLDDDNGDEKNRKRVTIASVNGGQDWIQDDDAVALRGRITATVTWDDVTEPANLLRKAKEWLAEHKKAVTALQLSAVDLSRLDRTMGTYHDGDLVPVRSKPHGVNEKFQLTDRTIDWLNPEGGNVTLGKTKTSLTGADALLERDVNTKIVILNNAVINGQIQTQQLERTLTSKIEQLAGSITLEVSGGLGNLAAIRLSVGEDVFTESLDLSDVRKKFADDPSTITIEAGTVTFNAGTFVVNSQYFQVDAYGVINATAGTIGSLSLCETGIYSKDDALQYGYTGWNADAYISNNAFFAGAKDSAGNDAAFHVTYGGNMFVRSQLIIGDTFYGNGCYITKFNTGVMELYYVPSNADVTNGNATDDQVGQELLCATISTKYYHGRTHGLSLRVEEAGNYIMFSHPNSSFATGYEVDYYLNYGFSTNYEEMHIFQTSARFLDKTVFQKAYCVTLYLQKNAYMYAYDYDGNIVANLLHYRDGTVKVGDSDSILELEGNTVVLGETGATVTSDRNAKNSIEELPAAYEAFVDALEPVRFKYNEGTSGRYHVGYIAQDVEAALTAAGLTTQDFAGYVDIGRTGELGLQYTEFIAILHKKIKRLEAQVAALQTAQ